MIGIIGCIVLYLSAHVLEFIKKTAITIELVIGLTHSLYKDLTIYWLVLELVGFRHGTSHGDGKTFTNNNNK